MTNITSQHIKRCNTQHSPKQRGQYKEDSSVQKECNTKRKVSFHTYQTFDFEHGLEETPDSFVGSITPCYIEFAIFHLRPQTLFQHTSVFP